MSEKTVSVVRESFVAPEGDIVEKVQQVDNLDGNDGGGGEVKFSASEYLKESLGSPIEEKKEEVEKLSPDNAYTWSEKTGRSPEDYFRLNKDWSSEQPDELLKSYYKEQGPDLTDREVERLIERKFGVEDEEDENEILDKGTEKKQEVRKALNYFTSLKEGMGVKSDAPKSVPNEYKSALELQKSIVKQQELAELNQRSYLDSLTNHYKEYDGIELSFSGEVDGVKKDVSLKYYPGDSELKDIIDLQRNTSAFFQKFGEVKEDGSFTLTDANGLFTALAVASNPSAVAKFFWEQGVSEARESFIKDELKRPNFESRPSQPLPTGKVVKVTKERL